MEMIDLFKDLSTTCLSDAMEGMNNLDSAIKPLKTTYRFAGRAVTIKVPVGDNLSVLEGIRKAKHGDVLIIDAKGDTYRAIAGDFVIGMMQTKGIAALVVDGVIRDVMPVKALDFPVFCKGTTVAAGGKAGVGEVNIPISCGGTAVNPGDIIVGDADGVVVIPQALSEVILKKALEKKKSDEIREEKVSGNHEEINKYLDNMLQNNLRGLPTKE